MGYPSTIPAPQRYVEQRPFGLFLGIFGLLIYRARIWVVVEASSIRAPHPWPGGIRLGRGLE